MKTGSSQKEALDPVTRAKIDAQVNVTLGALTTEIERCQELNAKIREPYSRRVYAVRGQWIDNLRAFLARLEILEHEVKEYLSSDEAKDDLFARLASFAPFNEPVENFKLVKMNQNYTRLVEKVMASPFPVDLTDLKAVFNDWGQMVLSEDSVSDLRDQISQEYQKIFNQDNFDLPDGVARQFLERPLERIELVNESCWLKIVSKFPLVGPEIAFYCEKDDISHQFWPDLEPITLSLAQYELVHSSLNSISQTTAAQASYNCSKSNERKILVSKNIQMIHLQHEIRCQNQLLSDSERSSAFAMFFVEADPSSPQSVKHLPPKSAKHNSLIESKNQLLCEFEPLDNGTIVCIFKPGQREQNPTPEVVQNMTIALLEQQGLIDDQPMTKIDQVQLMKIDNDLGPNHVIHKRARFALDSSGDAHSDHHDIYNSCGASDNDIPPEYKNDPDMYRAIQASLQCNNAPQDEGPHPTHHPLNLAVGGMRDVGNSDLNFSPMSGREGGTGGNIYKSKTPSTAEQASNNQNLIDPQNKHPGRSAVPASILRNGQEEASMRKTPFKELRAQQMAEVRKKKREQFVAKRAKAQMITESKEKAMVPADPKKKRMTTTRGSQLFTPIVPLSKMGPLKTFSQISSNMNRLHQNIFTAGVEESILKIGQELPLPQKRKKSKKPAGRGGVSSDEGEFEQYQSNSPRDTNKLRGRSRDAEKSGRMTEKDLINMKSKPFYSPRQKSTEQSNQQIEIRFNIDHVSGKTGDTNKTLSRSDSPREQLA